MSLLWCSCLLACGLRAETPPPPKAGEKPGEWLPLSKDGTAWQHEATDLRFPQHLGDFRLHVGFRDKRASAGVALTYVHEKGDIKGDIVIFPCSQDFSKVKDAMAFLHGEHDKLVSEMQAASRDQGYNELKRGAVEEKALAIWMGSLPMTVQTFELGPQDSAKEATKPKISQWFGLVLYQDHFVQMSIVRPTASGANGEKLRDELIKLLLQCIREPSVAEDMIKLCKRYIDGPLSKEGRAAADSLMVFSKESPVFEVVFPGEALTIGLDEVSAISKDAGYDLLRAFIVGSGVVALHNGAADECLEEGARVCSLVYGLLKKQNPQVTSTFMDGLAEASAKTLGAAYLRKKMDEKPVEQ